MIYCMQSVNIFFETEEKYGEKTDTDEGKQLPIGTNSIVSEN